MSDQTGEFVADRVLRPKVATEEGRILSPKKCGFLCLAEWNVEDDHTTYITSFETEHSSALHLLSDHRELLRTWDLEGFKKPQPLSTKALFKTINLKQSNSN